MSKLLKDDLREINEAVPNEALRHLIFGGDNEDDDEFLCRVNEIYKYFNSVLEIAFFFVYARFKQWQKTDRYLKYSLEKGTHNFNRVVTSFEQLYNSKELTPDIISDDLMDIQIDIAKSLHDETISGDEDKHQALNDFFLKYDINRSPSYNEIDYLAKQYVTYNHTTDPLDEPGTNILHIRRDTLIHLIRNIFPFLRKIKNVEKKNLNGLKRLYKDKEDVRVEDSEDLKELIFTYRNDAKTDDRQQYELPDEVEFNYTLIASRYSYYYLEKIERMQLSKVKGSSILALTYIKLADSSSMQTIYVLGSNDNIECLHDGDYFIQDDTFKTTLENVYFNFQKKASTSKTVIRDFATINYRYVKELSLSLCDLLDDDMKRWLFAKYGTEHPELFGDENKDGQLDDYEISKVDWDSSIAVLIIDEGATMVLRTILLKSSNSKFLFTSLCNNLEQRFGPKKFSSAKAVKGAQEEYDRIRKLRNEYSRMDMVPNEIRSDFDKEESYLRAEISASYLIDVLSRINSGGIDKEKTNYLFPVSIITREKMLNKIEHTHSSIEKKVEGLIILGNLTMVQLISFYEGFYAYAYQIRSFGDENGRSKSVLAELQSNANKAFFKAFSETFERLTLKENFKSDLIVREIIRLNNESSRPSENPILHNKYTYTKYFLGRRSFVDTDCFEKIKGLSDIAIEEYEEAFKLVKQMFYYLKTGVRQGKPLTGNETAIYPYIATHLFNHESRDGFVIKHFEVLVEDETDQDIKVLSNFDYQKYHRYYCLPSSLRYNSKIDVWIEPILIDYNVFEGR